MRQRMPRYNRHAAQQSTCAGASVCRWIAYRWYFLSEVNFSFFNHPRSDVVYYYNFGLVCESVCLSDSLSVCMYTYVCQTIAFESLDVGSSFSSHIWYISSEYETSSRIKVIGSRSRSHPKKARKSLFPQCKISIGNNSGYIKHITTKFACSMGFLDTADRIMWPPSL